jgi:hypothetical protein
MVQVRTSIVPRFEVGASGFRFGEDGSALPLKRTNGVSGEPLRWLSTSFKSCFKVHFVSPAVKRVMKRVRVRETERDRKTESEQERDREVIRGKSTNINMMSTSIPIKDLKL